MSYRNFLKQQKLRHKKIADEVKKILNREFDNNYDNETFLRLWNNSFIKDNCWIHNISRNKDGYGNIYYKETNTHAHRVSACLFLGLDINNKKQQSNHKSICCDKACWNPEHIYIGSHSENMLDSVELKTHINARKINCGTCGNEYDKLEGSRNGITRRCSKCRKLSSQKYYA